MALSADTSPPPARGDSGQPAEDGGPGGTARPSENAGPGETAQPAGDAGSRDSATLPGLPRLFFADEPDQRQEQVADRPYGQPADRRHDTGPGQPGSFGQPDGLGDQARPGPPDGFGQPQPRQPAGRRGPAAQPARPRRTRQPDRELRQRAVASLVLGVLSLVALLGLWGNQRRFVYLLIFSVVIGVASSVIGITAVLKARRTGSYRPRGAVGGIALGALAALISIVMLTLYLAFPRQIDNYIRCRSQAQTAASRQSCMDKLRRSIQPGWRGPGSGAAAAPAPAPRLSRGPTGSAGHPGLAQGSADGPPGRLPDGAPSPFFAHLSR